MYPTKAIKHSEIRRIISPRKFFSDVMTKNAL